MSENNCHCYIHEFETTESAQFVMENIIKTLEVARVIDDKKYFHYTYNRFGIISGHIIPLLAGTVNSEFEKQADYIFDRTTQKVTQLSLTNTSTAYITSNLEKTNKRKKSKKSFVSPQVNPQQSQDSSHAISEHKKIKPDTPYITLSSPPPEQSSLRSFNKK